MNYNTIVKMKNNVVIIPDISSLILYSPDTMKCVKYPTALLQILAICSTEVTIAGLTYRANRLGLKTELEEILTLVQELYDHGMCKLDGSEVRVKSSYKKESDSKSSKLRAPYTAVLHLTKECNKSCIYCYNSSHRRSEASKDMSVSEWIRVINDLRESGVQSFVLTGGEPLLRKDVINRIVDEDLSGYWSIITNASKLDDEIMSKIRKKIKAITISIDSCREEIADRMRGLGTYREVVKAMKLMKKYDMQYGVNVVLTKHNIEHYQETYDWLVANGCTSVTPIIQSIAQYGISECMPSISQIERHYDIHYEHIINCSKRIDVEKDVLNSRSAFLAPRRGCSAAVLECAIGSDGSIYPCRMLMYEEMRSRETLVKKDFNSIWYTDDVLRRIREETQVPESCYQCPYSRLCAGECPAHRVNDNGQIMHSVPIPYCTIYKQVISRKIQVNLKYAE